MKRTIIDPSQFELTEKVVSIKRVYKKLLKVDVPCALLLW